MENLDVRLNFDLGKKYEISRHLSSEEHLQITRIAKYDGCEVL